MVRTFTLSEARALLPRVVGLLGRAQQLDAQLAEARRALASRGLLTEGAELPHPEAVPEESREAATLAVALAELRRAPLAEIGALGVVLRDPVRGHVDFPTVLDGQREVVLCFRLGDRELGHFHEPGGDLSSRRPVGEHRFFDRRQLRPPGER